MIYLLFQTRWCKAPPRELHYSNTEMIKISRDPKNDLLFIHGGVYKIMLFFVTSSDLWAAL